MAALHLTGLAGFFRGSNASAAEKAAVFGAAPILIVHVVDQQRARPTRRVVVVVVRPVGDVGTNAGSHPRACHCQGDHYYGSLNLATRGPHLSKLSNKCAGAHRGDTGGGVSGPAGARGGQDMSMADGRNR